MKSRSATGTRSGLRSTMWADAPRSPELHLAPAGDCGKVTTGLEGLVTHVLDVSWQSLNAADTDDLLDALFSQSEASSAVASPLWSPCTTDSGIHEEPLADPTDSFPSSFYAACPTFDTPFFPPSLESQPPPAEKNPYASVDLSKFFPLERGKNASLLHDFFQWLSPVTVMKLFKLQPLCEHLWRMIFFGCYFVGLCAWLFFVLLCEITAKKKKKKLQYLNDQSMQQHKDTLKVWCGICVGFSLLSHVFLFHLYRSTSCSSHDRHFPKYIFLILSYESEAIWPIVTIVLVQSAGWESCQLQQEFGIAYYLSKTQTSPLPPHQTLSVKDLLLSNLGKTVRRSNFSNFDKALRFRAVKNKV